LRFSAFDIDFHEISRANSVAVEQGVETVALNGLGVFRFASGDDAIHRACARAHRDRACAVRYRVLNNFESVRRKALRVFIERENA
jgi:hypothetical protein